MGTLKYMKKKIINYKGYSIKPTRDGYEVYFNGKVQIWSKSMYQTMDYIDQETTKGKE